MTARILDTYPPRAGFFVAGGAQIRSLQYGLAACA